MTASPALVAIVDDEESVGRALQRLLRSEDFDTQLFTSGDDFLGSVSITAPACVILDLHLPGMSGLDVQRSLVDAGVSTGVIVVTGFDKPGMCERVLAAGASAYLLKPLDSTTLLRAVRESIGIEDP